MTISPTLRALAEKYIRPSALGAIAECEGRPLMEARVVELDGEPPVSEVADLGTDGHRRIYEAIESWKLCQETGEHGAEWGDTIAAACNAATEDGVDGWTVICIQRCLEFARDIITKHGIEPDNVLGEHQLDMASVGFKQLANSGRADLVLVVPGKLVIVVDWKLGFIDQGDATEHDQTQAYAAAAAETFQATEVQVFLVQPRAPKLHRITGAKYDAQDLRDNRAWTASVLTLARAANPRLTAGYQQCLHCRALTRCPEARRFIMDASEALAALGHPLDADGFGELANAAKTADKFAEVGKDIVKERLLAGGDATGWHLGTPRAIQSVTGVPEAMRKLRDAGLESEVLANATSLSVSKLPAAALPVIQEHLVEKLSSPPLTVSKRSKATA